MASFTPSPDRDVSNILGYWFDAPSAMTRWFVPSKTVDDDIRTQFAPLICLAAASQLPSWTTTPRSSLALVILLDQFPRNIYRNSSQSYATDSLALETTLDAIARGYDRELPLIQSAFFYLPLMHDETLKGQIAGMTLLEVLKSRCIAQGDTETAEFVGRSWDFAKRHLDVVRMFGRFPSRNKALGRASTEKEIRFLEEHPEGF